MKYQTQKVALLYFYGALGLFLAQVLFGVLAGTIYVLPNTLSELLPFNIVRMVHTNALIVWLLMGFMGATYYLIPEETETEGTDGKAGRRHMERISVPARAKVQRLAAPVADDCDRQPPK